MPRKIVHEIPNQLRHYDDGTILIMNVRFSYPHVDAPWSKKESERKKYSLTGLMPKKGRQAAKKYLDDFIAKMLAEKKLKSMASKDKFLRDGDDSGKEYYPGNWSISSSEENPVSVRGPDTRPIPQGEIKSKVQPGYWGDMLIRPWFQDNEHGKKVNAGLVAVQVKKKDEIFGEGRVSEDDIDETFDAVDEDEFEAGDGDDSGAEYADDEDDDGGL